MSCGRVSHSLYQPRLLCADPGAETGERCLIPEQSRAFASDRALQTDSRPGGRPGGSRRLDFDCCGSLTRSKNR